MLHANAFAQSPAKMSALGCQYGAKLRTSGSQANASGQAGGLAREGKKERETFSIIIEMESISFRRQAPPSRALQTVANAKRSKFSAHFKPLSNSNTIFAALQPIPSTPSTNWQRRQQRKLLTSKLASNAPTNQHQRDKMSQSKQEANSSVKLQTICSPSFSSSQAGAGEQTTKMTTSKQAGQATRRSPLKASAGAYKSALMLIRGLMTSRRGSCKVAGALVQHARPTTSGNKCAELASWSTSMRFNLMAVATVLMLLVVAATTECYLFKRTQYHEQGLHGPKSYKFGFTSGDHKNPQERHEVSDGHGHVKGWYSFVDATGKHQVVHYEAGKHGFKVLNMNSHKAYNNGKRHYNS